MNRGIRILIAVVLITVLYFLWIVLGSALFGWKHGGGAIPTILFFSMAAYVWKTITKKDDSSKKIDKPDNNEE